MNKFRNLLWGLVFLAIGIVWGLNAMGITDISLFFKGWWTLFIIVPCFIGLFSKDGKTGNFIGLLIGVVLLLSAQGFIAYDIIWKLALPVILCIIGLSLIFRDVINTKINSKLKELNRNGLEDYSAVFGEQNVNLPNTIFQGAKLDAIFGGVNFNMRDAIIEKEQMISATAVFGGITIIAPKDVNIKVKSTPIFGGVSNKAPQIQGDNIPTLYINAFCMFGGVDIK